MHPDIELNHDSTSIHACVRMVGGFTITDYLTLLKFNFHDGDNLLITYLSNVYEVPCGPNFPRDKEEFLQWWGNRSIF